MRGGMTQEERWNSRFLEVLGFVLNNNHGII